MSELPEVASGIFELNLNNNCIPRVLAAIFDVNVSVLYGLRKSGKYTKDIKDLTYLEAIRETRQYLINNNEKGLLKIRLAHEEKARFNEENKSNIAFSEASGEGMAPITVAKMMQEIRLSKVKEQQTWFTLLTDRGKYQSSDEMAELMEPIVQNIRNALMNISTQSAEAQKQVDSVMESLYDLGITLIAHSKEDEDLFMKEILKKELDIREIETATETKLVL